MRALAFCLLALWVAATATLAGAQDTSATLEVAPANTPATVVDPAPPKAATPVDLPLYEDPKWQDLTKRTQAALQAGRASDFVFATLRSDLVEWRTKFSDRQADNAGRIRTLKSQIAALNTGSGEEGADAPEQVIAVRDRLQAQLAQLQVPVLLRSEAYVQADRLIAEIDALIRDRWFANLTTPVPSPLNPEHWLDAWTNALDGLQSIWNETASHWDNPIRRGQFIDALPIALIVSLLGLILLLRGEFWSAWISRHLEFRTRRGRGVVTFLVSLGKLVLPLFGAYLISVALQNTGLFGLRGERIVSQLPMLALYVVVARWLLAQLFVDDASVNGNSLELSDEVLANFRRLFITLAWTLTAGVFVKLLAKSTDINDSLRAVLMFPIGLIAAVLLWRIGGVLRSTDAPSEEDADAPRPYRVILRATIGRALRMVGLGAVVLGLLGYADLFDLLIYATSGTLFLLGALILLQRLVFDLYSLIVRSEDGSREALVPVLISFFLAFAALPVLALIWGARVSDIEELWTRFREGFQIGSTQISPTDFLTFIVVFAIGYTATRLLQGALRTTVLPKTKLDTGGQTAIVSGMGYIGIFLAALIAITTAGIDLSGLAIVAGALSVGIGFGMQNIVSNFVSGIILLIERPISQGDWIEVGGQMGYVRNISVRSTRIETFERTDVIIPNADLVSGSVTNFTRGNTVGRVVVPVGVAYGTDTDLVESILLDIAKSHPMVLYQPEPTVVFQQFGADSLEFEIRAFLRDVNWVINVKSEMNHQINRRFSEAGIEIPFGQRDIWLRNPEALAGGHLSGPRETAPAKDISQDDTHAHLQASDMQDGGEGDGSK